MPIKNEEKYLPYSLASLKQAPLDELVVSIETPCTDNSEEIISRFHPPYPIKVFHERCGTWRNRIAEAVEQTFRRASGDVVYSLFADVIYDPNIFRLHPFKTYDMVSFRYFNRDLNTNPIRIYYEHLLSKVYEKIDFHESVWRGAVFGTKRKVWQKLHFKDIVSQYGEHLQFKDYRDRLQQNGYKHLHDKTTNNIDLRSTTFTKETQLKEGALRASKGYPPWKIFLHALIHLKPHIPTGYFNART